MRQHDIQPKVNPGKIIDPPKGPKKGIQSDPILLLVQNSRRILPSSIVPQHGPSIFRSCALFLKKVLTSVVSLGGRKRNLYEKLEDTINEMQEGAQKADEKLVALKNRAENQREVTRDEGRKQ